MNFDEALHAVESPHKGLMHGVKVLVEGFADEGRLAVRLGRHSAKVLVVIADDVQRARFADQKPQALDITPVSDGSSFNSPCNAYVKVVSYDSYIVQFVPFEV